MRELSESRKMMELEVLHHRSQLRLEFLTLEAFVSEMDWAIADLVETARCRVDDEGSEGLTVARIDHILASRFADRLGYGAIVVTYATVERSLVTLCDLAQQATHQRFSVHDLHGSGLRRFCTVRSTSCRHRTPPGRGSSACSSCGTASPTWGVTSRA